MSLNSCERKTRGKNSQHGELWRTTVRYGDTFAEHGKIAEWNRWVRIFFFFLGTEKNDTKLWYCYSRWFETFRMTNSLCCNFIKLETRPPVVLTSSHSAIKWHQTLFKTCFPPVLLNHFSFFLTRPICKFVDVSSS